MKELWHNGGQVRNPFQGVEHQVHLTDISINTEDDPWAGIDLILGGLFPQRVPNLVQNELSKYALSVRNDGPMGRTLMTQTPCLISDTCLLYGSFEHVMLFLVWEVVLLHLFLKSLYVKIVKCSALGASVPCQLQEEPEGWGPGVRMHGHEVLISATPDGIPRREGAYKVCRQGCESDEC